VTNADSEPVGEKDSRRSARERRRRERHEKMSRPHQRSRRRPTEEAVNEEEKGRKALDRGRGAHRDGHTSV
jgi:hypothetical protein